MRHRVSYHPMIIDPTHENIGVHAQGGKSIAAHHTQITSLNSLLGADARPMFRSPLQSIGQGIDMFVTYPPVYETLGHETQVHEISGASIKKNG